MAFFVAQGVNSSFGPNLGCGEVTFSLHRFDQLPSLCHGLVPCRCFTLWFRLFFFPGVRADGLLVISAILFCLLSPLLQSPRRQGEPEEALVGATDASRLSAALLKGNGQFSSLFPSKNLKVRGLPKNEGERWGVHTPWRLTTCLSLGWLLGFPSECGHVRVQMSRSPLSELWQGRLGAFGGFLWIGLPLLTFIRH